MKKILSTVFGFALFALVLTSAGIAFAAENPTTSSASNITITSATLNGINGDSNADAGTEAFWYGPTTHVNPFIAGGMQGDWTGGLYAGVFDEAPSGNFSYSLTGLNPDTDYFYVAWVRVLGTWFPGSEIHFKTLPNSQTITFDALTPKTYGDSDFDVSATGGLSGNPVTFSTLSTACSITGSTVHIISAGDCTITADQAAGGGYTVASSTDLTFTIAQKPLTLTGTSVTSKVYDKTTIANLVFTLPTLVGVVGADDVTSDTTGATGTYDNYNAGTGKTVTVVGITLTGADTGNYTLTQPTATGDITARPITVRPTSLATKVYDSNNSSAGVPVITVGTLAPLDTAGFIQKYNNRHVGVSKNINASGIVNDGNGGNNYLVTFDQRSNGIITVATLNVTPSAPNKVYDGTRVATLTFTDNRISGDIFTISGTARFANKNVGTGKVVQILTVNKTGIDADNYAMNVSGSLVLANITPLAISVTAQANSKEYDGNTTSSTLPALSIPLVGTDTAVISQTYDNKDVVGSPTKTMTPTVTITDGNGGNNYLVTLVPVNSGTISTKSLTLTGTSVTSKVYDKTLPATLNFTGASLVGLIAPDTSVTVTFSGGTGVYTDSNVGTSKPVTITGVTLGGSGAGNYTLTQPTATGDITARPITVRPTSLATKVYDNNTSSIGIPVVTSGSIVVGDTSGFIQTYGNKNVGNSKNINASGVVVDGNSGNNYLVTFNQRSNAIITPAILTATIASFTKIYDGSNSATNIPVSLIGVLGGNSVSAIATGTFPDKNVGNPLGVTITGVTLSGAQMNNYSLPVFPATAPGSSITLKPITVTATAQNKVFDGTTTANVTLANDALLGDTVTQTSTSANFDTSVVGTGKLVTVLGITIGGVDATNYSLAIDSATANADITEAPLVRRGGGGGLLIVPSNTASTGQVLGVSTIASNPFQFLTNFRPGSKLTPDVTELQKILITKGFLKIKSPTGSYGPLTVSAVRAYQRANKIPATGNVFNMTRAALNLDVIN